MNDLLRVFESITYGLMQVLGYLVALADPGICCFSSDDNHVHYRFTHRRHRMGLTMARVDGSGAHGVLRQMLWSQVDSWL